MTESADVYRVRAVPPADRRAPGDIALLACDRCSVESLPWELRTFGKQSICGRCYGATLELAGAAIRSMPADGARRCAQCRAMRDPQFGSAWCGAIELGDERALICANFVSLRSEELRPRLNGGRSRALEVWRDVTDELRTALGEANFGTWFGRVEVLSLDGDELTLSVPDEYTADWLSQRFGPVIHQAFVARGHAGIEPVYLVGEVGERPPLPSEVVRAKVGFNPHYTFEEFVVGAGNRLAHASAQAVLRKVGTAYNPLVLYGGVGVGKTHLLQAIGQAAIDGGKDALYVTSEMFTNELILAIRDGVTQDFRDRYRTVDFLLIDDVQFIAGKEATQEEFFHTFNALHQSGKQIVITSDRPPSELRGLQDRLVSRFTWGMAADIQAPDLETRMAILRRKAAQRALPDDVLSAVATRIGSNVRELEGTLNRVLAQADLLGTEPSLDVVRGVLGDGVVPGSARPDAILEAVASYFRIRGSELCGPQRERAIAYARQIAMYLLREESKLSLLEVGNHLGGRNHSTVIYGCSKIEKEVKHKGRVRQDILAVKQLLYGS